jgi:hypothetical protein
MLHYLHVFVKHPKEIMVVVITGQAISQDFMLVGVRESLGIQTKSGSAEPGCEAPPRTAKPCWEWLREGVAPSRHGGPGVGPRKIFEIVNALR